MNNYLFFLEFHKINGTFTICLLWMHDRSNMQYCNRVDSCPDNRIMPWWFQFLQKKKAQPGIFICYIKDSRCTVLFHCTPDIIPWWPPFKPLIIKPARCVKCLFACKAKKIITKTQTHSSTSLIYVHLRPNSQILNFWERSIN